METQRFTLLELLPVITGRLHASDSLKDAERVLSHLFDTPVRGQYAVYQYIESLKGYTPFWLIALRAEVHAIEAMETVRAQLGFWGFLKSKKRVYKEMIIQIGKEYNYYFDIPKLLKK